MAYEQVNRIQQFNFQINRVLTYGELACNANEIKSALCNVKTMEEWFAAWLKVAQRAKAEKSYMHAAYAYRMAEFFLKEKHPQKQEMYDKAAENFYAAFDEMKIPYVISDIPYKGTTLHSVKLSAKTEKQVILICGGYDSFVEEFIPAVLDILYQGYTLIFFEGDGQGKTLQNGLPLIHSWEEPTACVMDWYDIQGCSMIGISWGGYLAMRAAAYEKRISSVVAYDVADNGYEIMTNIFPPLLRRLIRLSFTKGKSKILNRLVYFAMKKSVIADWVFSQGQHITHTATPYAFFQQMSKHSLNGVSEKVTQDVLLLAGEEDHYIPINQYERLQLNLPNVRTLTCHRFSVEEGGEQHCQIGDHKLAINKIMHWLDSKIHS